MKKIYLLSGPGKTQGFSEQIKKELKIDLQNTKTISFIASSPDQHEKNLNYVFGTDIITGMINHLQKIHLFENVNIIDKLNIDKEILINSDVIYLLGGNYKTQLDFIKENKLDEIIQNFKGVLLCTSCGAMNIAKKGYYSKDEKEKESFFFDGLGIVDITIDPHFDINNQEQVEEAIKISTTQKIYGVPDESAIKVDNQEIKYIGNIYIFEKNHLIK